MIYATLIRHYAPPLYFLRHAAIVIFFELMYPFRLFSFAGHASLSLPMPFQFSILFNAAFAIASHSFLRLSLSFTHYATHYFSLTTLMITPIGHYAS
jgi:hypothetical protein